MIHSSNMKFGTDEQVDRGATPLKTTQLRKVRKRYVFTVSYPCKNLGTQLLFVLQVFLFLLLNVNYYHLGKHLLPKNEII